MVFCFRFRSDGSFGWCHSNNPACTVHTITIPTAAVTGHTITPIRFLGSWGEDNHPSEWYEVQAHNGALSDTDLQSLCNDLANKWPDVAF